MTNHESLIVEAVNLTKKYGSTTAVDDIELGLSKGELFGLIGPDGAGKTTIFHMLAGILEPSSGTLSVLGMEARDARVHTGYVTQLFSLYLDLTIEQNLQYAARLQDVSKENFEKLSNYYLELMDLIRFTKRLAGNLSGGMKQKLALCCALISRPELLLLDEPTTGVDPVSRRDFWDVLSSISAEGVTIAIATPYLDEAERCSRIALIHKGVILKTGTPSLLKEELGLKRLELRGTTVSLLESLVENSQPIREAVTDIQEFGDRVDILVENPAAVTAGISHAAAAQHISVTVSEQQPTLENVFTLVIADTQANESGIPTHVPRSEFPFSKESEAQGVAVGAQKLTKDFGDFRAVDQVDISLKYGEVYGLLGANGAGKTTTIKMLCGLLEPSSGNMSLAGASSNLQDPLLRRKIGYMSQKFTLYEDLTVLENLEFYSGIYNVSKQLVDKRIEWALQTCELSGHETSLTKELPGGFRQRLAFAASVLHQPQILFLDEPTSGVDPIARRQLWSLISSFARHGAAILVTTHFLEEAEYCRELGFMASGQLVASGTPDEIKRSQPGILVELRTDHNQLAINLLHTILPRWRASIFGDSLHIAAQDEKEESELINQLQQKSISIVSKRHIPFTLEDAFIGISQRNRIAND